MTLQPVGTKNALTLEDLAPYPRLSYEQGEHNSFYFSEEILSTLDSKAEGGLAGAGRADDGRGGLFRDGEADVVQNLTVIVAKAHMVEGYVEMSQWDVPTEGLHHRKAAGIFKDGTSHIPVGLCLHRGVLCAVPGDEQQKTQ